MKGKGERSVGEGGVKRPLNERKENVWKGRKAGCEPASLFVGDTLSTDGQWLHWIVLKNREKRKKKKRKIRLCSRIGRCVEEKKREQKWKGKKKGRRWCVVAGGSRGEGYYHLNRGDRFHSPATCPSYRPSTPAYKFIQAG